MFPSRARDLLIVGTLASLAGVVLVLFPIYGRSYWVPVYLELTGKQTVAEVVARYGEPSRAELKPRFKAAGLAYPPERVAFLVTKDDKRLEVWASARDGWHPVKDYAIRAASGGPGPKLREGDRQVPEGLYDVVGLNPNSSYHLSMKLNYPNAFDRRWAARDGRTNPGSNIFIHGKAVSIGCLAMGDPAIEELFILAHDVGVSHIKVVIAPTDPRSGELTPPRDARPWVAKLYDDIEAAFRRYTDNDTATFGASKSADLVAD